MLGTRCADLLAYAVKVPTILEQARRTQTFHAKPAWLFFVHPLIARDSILYC